MAIVYVNELQEALANDRMGDLEQGFRTLVRWPFYDALFGSFPELREVMLCATCHALLNNRRTMVDGTAAHLAADFQGLRGQSYAAGARLVLDNWPAFSRRVARTYADAMREED